MALRYIVLSALGADRVGIADDIASWVDQAGGNVEESKMAVLGGDFAVIMLISGNNAVAETLVNEAPAFSVQSGLRLEARETSAPRPPQGGRPYKVESVSLDSPGLVHALTKEIRALGISIEDLETDSSAAPWTGAPVFRMVAKVILPSSLPVADFKEHMEDLAHRRDLDIRLEPFSG